MPYATQSDLETRFGATEIRQLGDRGAADPEDEEAEPVPSAAEVIDAALDDASQEIDGYIAVRYTLPLSETPALLTRLCCDIARYRLWSDDATDQIRQRYEDAVTLLTRLSSGSVQLGLSATDATSPATPGSRVSYFTDTTLALMP